MTANGAACANFRAQLLLSWLLKLHTPRDLGQHHPGEKLWLGPTNWPATQWLEVFPLWQQKRQEFARTHPGSGLVSPLEMMLVGVL